MWHPKIRGYMYEIVEMYPGAGGDQGIRFVSMHDRLEDAEKVMAVLESVNYNFTTYGMMMRPVWEDEHIRRQVKRAACDHNGSTTMTTTSGQYIFNCPKCGEHWEGNMDSYGNLSFPEYPGWDANGSPQL